MSLLLHLQFSQISSEHVALRKLILKQTVNIGCCPISVIFVDHVLSEVVTSLLNSTSNIS
jgi:hypothetical protein